MPRRTHLGDNLRLRLYLSDGRIIGVDNAIQRYRWIIDEERHLEFERPDDPVPISSWYVASGRPERTGSVFAYDSERIDKSFDTYAINVEAQAVIQDAKRDEWDSGRSWFGNWRNAEYLILVVTWCFALWLIWSDTQASHQIETQLLRVVERAQSFRPDEGEAAPNTPPDVAVDDTDWLEPTPTVVPAVTPTPVVVREEP